MKGTRARLSAFVGSRRKRTLLAISSTTLLASCIPAAQTAQVEQAPAPAAQQRPQQAQRATIQPLRRVRPAPPVLTTGVTPSTIPMQSARNGYQHQTRPYQYPASPYQYQRPAAPMPIASPQVVAAQRALDARLRSIGEGFNGDVGIAVRDIQTGWTTHFDGARHFPQQSVSKFWVSLTAFDKADRGEINLAGPVTVRKSDLTLFNQPIAALVKGDGYNTTLNNLIYRALTQSDNTANDFVLWRTGGPDAVRSFLASKGINGVRFGPGERVMQAQIAGMQWRPSMVGSGFYAARSSLPMETRRSALERYLQDPVDGATPLGVVEALARLKKGELLSPASTQRILSIMSNTRTGKQRLNGGLAPGWRLAHKTGTGQILGGTSTGYNDIGIVTSPDGRSYAVAAMIRRTSAPIPQRMAMMQNVVRAVIDYDRNIKSYGYAPARPYYAPPPAPPADYPQETDEDTGE